MELDDWITGSRRSKSYIDLKCQRCQHEWKAYGYEELGQFDANEEEYICPNCGTEIEE